MSITPVDPSDQITLPTDRQPGDLIESQDINQIAQAVNHLSSSSGIGEIDHRDLTNRDAANQHPIGAVTGLTTTLANKADVDHSHTAAQISDATTTGRVLMQASSAIAARTSIGAAASTHTHDNRYYTEDEVDTALADKADTGHAHDDRYYTQTEVKDQLDDKANATHQHPVTDLETTGTPDDTTYLRGDGAWATPAGGGAAGGLRFIKPAVNHYFSSPLLYGGVDDKPKGHIGPTYYPAYASALTVGEVSIWVNVAGQIGHTAEVVVYAATEDGLLGAVVTTTTHDVSSIGRKGVTITPFVWPEYGVWTTVNLSESGARLRVAGFAPLGTSGSGQGSAAAFDLNQRAVVDPNNSGAGDNPAIVAFKRTA